MLETYQWFGVVMSIALSLDSFSLKRVRPDVNVCACGASTVSVIIQKLRENMELTSNIML